MYIQALNNYQDAFTFFRRMEFKSYPTEKRRGHCPIKGYISTIKWHLFFNDKRDYLCTSLLDRRNYSKIHSLLAYKLAQTANSK